MNTDLQRIFESKAAHRRKLADLPIGEKLRLLDAMRERAILGATPQPAYSVLRKIRILPRPKRRWVSGAAHHGPTRNSSAIRIFPAGASFPA